MPITDYNKKKPLEVSSTNDSGTTQDKAQPILVRGESFTQVDVESTNYTSTDRTGTSLSITCSTNITDANIIAEDIEPFVDSISNSSADITYEVVNSNSETVLSKTVNVSSTGRERIFATASDYSKTLTNETFTINITISGGQFKIRNDDSFSGNIVTYSNQDVLGGESLESTFIRFAEVQVENTENTTGTGDIVVDFTNISDAQDIAVYDENGNLLDYEVESLDTAAETGVIWAYDSWVRDDSVQAQIAYGNNSANEDRSVDGTGSNPWDNGQNAELVYPLDETSGQTIDSTSNNRDSVSTTGTQFNISGPFNGARGFDGTDDVIESGLTQSDVGFTNTTIVAWITPDISNPSSDQSIAGNFDGTNQWLLAQDSKGGYKWYTFDGSIHGVQKGGTNPTADTDNLLIGTYNGNDYELVVNNTSVSTETDSTFVNPSNPFGVGADNRTSGINNPYDGDIDAFRIYSDAKSADWKQAEYDASPKAGQVYFSQQAAEATVTDQTVTIPETQTSSTNPAPEVNATVDISIPTTTATSVNPAPTVSPGAAPVNLTATTANTVNPDFTVQPGSTTVQTPVSTSTVSNPDPQVNAFNQITVPETNTATLNPAPALTVGQTIITPETTVSSSNPDVTVQPGETSLNISTTQVSATNPEFGLNRQIVVGVATNLQSENPEPNLQAGLVSVQVPETSILTENPALQVQPGVTSLQIERPTNVETDNPDFNTVSGAAELQVSETQLTASVQEPSIGLTLEFVSPTNALITNDERFFDMPDHTFTEGDLGDTLQATLKDDVSPEGVDLTGATEIRLVVKDRDGVKVFDKEMSLADRVNGKVEYKWSQGDFIEEPGVYRAKIKVFDSSNEPESFPNDGFRTIEVEEEIS